jgi:hypothetical protein
MADEHGEPGVGGFRRELADEPGLADAGLAADERERRVAATGQPHRGRQRGHLVATAHEDRAHYAGAHDPDVATPGRPLAINCGRQSPGGTVSPDRELLRPPSMPRRAVCGQCGRQSALTSTFR